MNVAVLTLIIWSLVQIILPIWGLALLKKDVPCINNSFTYLRIFLIFGCVMFTIFLSYFLCNNICYNYDDSTNMFIVLSAGFGGIMAFVMVFMVAKGIDDCAANTSSFKIALYSNLALSLLPLGYCIGKLYTTKSDFGAILEIKRSEKHQQDLAKQLREQAKTNELQRTLTAKKQQELDARSRLEEANKTAAALQEQQQQIDKLAEEKNKTINDVTSTPEFRARQRVIAARTLQQAEAKRRLEDSISTLTNNLDRFADNPRMSEKILTDLQYLKQGKQVDISYINNPLQSPSVSGNSFMDPGILRHEDFSDMDRSYQRIGSRGFFDAYNDRDTNDIFEQPSTIRPTIFSANTVSKRRREDDYQVQPTKLVFPQTPAVTSFPTRKPQGSVRFQEEKERPKFFGSPNHISNPGSDTTEHSLFFDTKGQESKTPNRQPLTPLPGPGSVRHEVQPRPANLRAPITRSPSLKPSTAEIELRSMKPIDERKQ